MGGRFEVVAAMECFLKNDQGNVRWAYCMLKGNTAGTGQFHGRYVLHPPLGITEVINHWGERFMDSAIQTVGKAIQKLVDQTAMIITGYDRAQKSFRSGESQFTGSSLQILHGKLSLSFEVLAGFFPKAQGILTRLLGKRFTEALALLLGLRENTVRLPVRLSQNLLVLNHQLFCFKTRLLSFFK